MTIRVDLNGTDCLRTNSTILPVGTKTVIVVVPNDTSKESCSDGIRYDCKAITFCDGEAISVKCISKTDLPRLRAYVATVHGTLDVLSTVPEILLKPISCPPPMLSADEQRQRLDEITKWMRDKDKDIRDAG